jgi:hypothetical protein
MKTFFSFILAGALLAALTAPPASAQTPPGVEKINAYVGCINRLSERSYSSRSRYFSWAAPSGPTGRERIIYGTYTIYDTSDCRKNVEKANALEPRDAALEAAATAYAKAVARLEPLLKEADDYYTQENYKDDKIAKGKALHPLLVSAWDAFEKADKSLRAGVEAINDKRALEKLAAIEQSEGKQARYHVEALMIRPSACCARKTPTSPTPRRSRRRSAITRRPSKAPNSFPVRAWTPKSARCSCPTPSRSSPRPSS